MWIWLIVIYSPILSTKYFNQWNCFFSYLMIRRSCQSFVPKIVLDMQIFPYQCFVLYGKLFHLGLNASERLNTSILQVALPLMPNVHVLVKI